MRACGGLERHGTHAADLAQQLFELPQQLEGALGDRVGRLWVEAREAGQHRIISVNSDLIHEIAALLPVSVHGKSRKRKRS